MSAWLQPPRRRGLGWIATAALTGAMFLQPIRPALDAAADGVASSGAPPAALSSVDAAEAYGKLPLGFEANQGQAPADVDFVAHGQGYSLSLTAGQAVLAVRPPRATTSAPATDPSSIKTPSVVRLELLGARESPQMADLDQLPGTANYFVGNDPSEWHTGIPTYAKVRYQDIYPGIDLVYYGRQGQLEYDFVVAPGADPAVIRLGFAGAGDVHVDAAGELVVQTAGGQLRQRAPVLYQDAADGRQVVAGTYVLNGAGELGFGTGSYDPTRPLVIDPVLVYSTLLGGAQFDSGNAIAVDAVENAYVTGLTVSSDFPSTPGVVQGSLHAPGLARYGIGDVFVAKLNPSGTALVYSSYLGGRGEDDPSGIAVDVNGNVYLTGFTQSFDFPVTTGAYSTNGNAFVAKLNANGSGLMYSTYVLPLGSDYPNTATGIAVDALGNAYITGQVFGNVIATSPDAFQTVFPRRSNSPSAFVIKLDPAGESLVYATYLGSSQFGRGDIGAAIAVDNTGSAYVTGHTTANDFPTIPGAFQGSSVVGGAFISKLNPSGTGLLYSTYLGGSGTDAAYAIAIDRAGDAYVTGSTGSDDFPTTPGAFQRAFHGVANTFVSKLNPTGTGLLYSTYLGGSGTDTGRGIASDETGNAYVTGSTGSADFPSTLGSVQPAFGGGSTDAFVSKLNPTGTELAYSTFLGGSGDDSGSGIALDAHGNAYVTGITSSSNFLTTSSAFQPSLHGSQDAFVSRISPHTVPECQLSGTGTTAGGQRFIQITTQDESSGLASIQVTEASNVIVQVSTFTPGTFASVVVTATKQDQTSGASVALRVTDQNGQVTDCDPAMVSVGRQPGESPVQVLHHLARTESHVTIVNGTPGVDRVRLVVNGHALEATGLKAGQSRTMDVSAAMRKGSTNTILVVGYGPPGGSAAVIVSDS